MSDKLERDNLDRPIAGNDGKEALKKTRSRLDLLEEFYAAHKEVESGVVSFDLHRAAVVRLTQATIALEQSARGEEQG